MCDGVTLCECEHQCGNCCRGLAGTCDGDGFENISALRALSVSMREWLPRAPIEPNPFETSDYQSTGGRAASVARVCSTCRLYLEAVSRESGDPGRAIAGQAGESRALFARYSKKRRATEPAQAGAASLHRLTVTSSGNYKNTRGLVRPRGRVTPVMAQGEAADPGETVADVGGYTFRAAYCLFCLEAAELAAASGERPPPQRSYQTRLCSPPMMPPGETRGCCRRVCHIRPRPA